MFRWSPPPRTKVVFKIDALSGPYHPDIVPAGYLTVDECERLRREFYSRFGLKYERFGFSQLNVDDPRWPEILDAVQESDQRRQLGLRGGGSAWLEEARPFARGRGAWFLLWPGSAEFRRASRVRAGVHFAYGNGGEVASQAFVDAVQRAGLTGFGSIPIVGRGDDDPLRWYDIFATCPLGRGLDHPLIDPEKWERRHPQHAAEEEALRRGDGTAWHYLFKDDLDIAHSIARRLFAMAGRYFRVDGPVHFVREYVPALDFAYPEWTLAPDDGDPGEEGRFARGLACSARARTVLLEQGVAKRSHFQAIPIISASEARSAVLDEDIRAPLPRPRWTPEEAASEIRRREAILVRGPAPHNEPRWSLREAEEALRQLGRDGPPWWVPTGATDRLEHIRRSQLFRKLPASWKRVVPLLPISMAQQSDEQQKRPEPRFDFEVAIPEWNSWLPSADHPGSPEDKPSRRDIVLATSRFGDWFSFRTNDQLLPDDARVTYWDHETEGVHDEWPTVAAFIQHMVSLVPQSASE